jgi:ubiquitin-like protein Pup
MPTREPGEQQHRTRSTEDQVEETAAAATAASSALAERKDALDADIDAILDDIDEALETNAEEFVRGFVQKGGE